MYEYIYVCMYIFKYMYMQVSMYVYMYLYECMCACFQVMYTLGQGKCPWRFPQKLTLESHNFGILIQSTHIIARFKDDSQ